MGMAILLLGLPLLVKDDCHLSGINRLQAFAQLHGGSADGHVSAHARSCAKRSATRSGQNPKKKIVLRDGQVKLAKDRWPVLGQLPPLLTLALCFIAPSLPRHRLHQLLPASRALAPFGLTGTCTLHHGDSGANSPH